MFWLLAIASGAITAIAASNRGRSWLGWFIIGFFLPLISLLALLLLPNLHVVLDDLKKKAMSRLCPHCKEPIRKDAVKCKHCGSAVEPMPMPAILSQEDLEDHI